MNLLAIICALLLATLSSAAFAQLSPIQRKAGCDIKGNIGRNNARLYHMPGDSGYHATKISKPDERWFCTEQEAQAAGWRRAGSFKPGLPKHNYQDCQIPPFAPTCCPIKGNVSNDRSNRGLRRYHIPGSPRYAETVIRQPQGDRWFCSVKQAEANGFEAAGLFIGKTAHDLRDCEIPPDIPQKVFDNGCFIKGNISGSGRIYHVRGSRFYFETQITTQRDERWFCSTREAELEGWRAPKRGGQPLACGPPVRGRNVATLPGCPQVAIMPFCLFASTFGPGSSSP